MCNDQSKASGQCPMDKMSSFILTGGESLLGWQRLYIELFEHPRMKDLKCYVPRQIQRRLYTRILKTIPKQDRFSPWSCSKTFLSGEPWDTANVEIALSYSRFNSEMYFKFVVADATDVDEVSRAASSTVRWESTFLLISRFHWEADQKSTTNTKNVPELAMARGWRYIPRLHVDIPKCMGNLSQ